MLRPATTPNQGRSHEGSWAPGDHGQEAGGWTAEGEARLTVANRGLATDKYVRGSRLGDGGWSRVYKVLRVTDGRVLASKVSEAAAKMKEAGILQSLHHHHILQFVDWHEEPGNAAASLLITELCGHGTLQTRIDHAAPSMDGGEILLAVRQVGDALAYLHERQLFHTDVKARNILVRGLAPLDGAPRLLREREAAGATGPGLGIKAPADFRPASFW